MGNYSKVLLYNSTFLNNSETAFAAAFDTNVSIVNSRFEMNSSPESGGAIYLNNSSHLEVLNTSFNNNSAIKGGAISLEMLLKYQFV